MTNEEKEAKRRFPLDEHKDKFTREMRNSFIKLFRKCFIQGCGYKEEQFKQYLLQKRDGLKWRSDHIGKNHGVCTELIDEIIKDLGL